MRPSKVISCIVSIFGVCSLTPQICSQAPAQGQRIVIGASEVLDGKGRILHDVYIVVVGAKIDSVGPSVGPVDYDLRGLTVLPGWIDAARAHHVEFRQGR
jgi:imidazolonepropionase-like amidohydrolase